MEVNTDNDDDFTFCQSGVHNQDNSHESKKLASEISGITLGDKLSSESGGSSIRESMPVDQFLGNTATKKQETVGSLSFNVIDTSSRKQCNVSSSEVASNNVKNSVKNLQVQKTAAVKRMPRTKVPFEKGYSQMDWLKLTRTHPDLAGLKGQSNKRLISLSEVRQHQTEDSMWTVLKGRVYNISPYMKFHPGGVDMLMKAVGKDCTSLFNKYHAWVNAEFLLEKCLVGILDDRQ